MQLRAWEMKDFPLRLAIRACFVLSVALVNNGGQLLRNKVKKVF